VELAGQTAQVRVEEQPLNLLPGLVLAGAAAGGSVLLLRRRKKRTKKAKAAAGNAS
jgi:LPXTG-motif cell wall-anchored protein